MRHEVHKNVKIVTFSGNDIIAQKSAFCIICHRKAHCILSILAHSFAPYDQLNTEKFLSEYSNNRFG